MSKYENSVFVGAWGISRGVSVNYERAFLHRNKSFMTASTGISYLFPSAAPINPITGESGKSEYYGIGIPFQLNYNYSLGNLDRRLFDRFSKKCNTKAPKFFLDWFAEVGLSAMPVYYLDKEFFEGIYTGYLGLRIQTLIRRPKKQKDLIIYLRGGYSPFYRAYNKEFSTTQTTTIGGSLGMSF